MRFRPLLLAAATVLSGGAASAQDGLKDLPIIGRPEAGGIGFQPAVTSLAKDLHWLDGLLLVIITAITLFVVALLGIVALRYNANRGHAPQTFTHNTPIEIAWTIVPIVILIFIGAFSLPILFDQQEIPEGEVTVKATGYQWYWGYEYPDHELAFDSYMIGSPATGGDNRRTPEVTAQLEEAGYGADEFGLATDTAMVVPVDTTVVVQVTGGDVIHSWTIPAFGVKQDGIPGRLAELWFKAEEEGVYFGQCSELCGISHAFMPITVKVVSQEAYETWLDGAIEEYGGTPRNEEATEASAEAPAEGEGGEAAEGEEGSEEGGEAAEGEPSGGGDGSGDGGEGEAAEGDAEDGTAEGEPAEGEGGPSGDDGAEGGDAAGGEGGDAASDGEGEAEGGNGDAAETADSEATGTADGDGGNAAESEGGDAASEGETASEGEDAAADSEAAEDEPAAEVGPDAETDEDAADGQ